MYALFQSLFTSPKPSTQELNNVLSDKDSVDSKSNEPPRFDRLSWFAKEAKKFAEDTIENFSKATNKVVESVSSFYDRYKDGPLFPGLLWGTGFTLAMVGIGTGLMPLLGVGMGLMALSSLLIPKNREYLYDTFIKPFESTPS